MGRYKKNIQIDRPIDVVSVVMEDFVYHNGFTRTDWNGEMVYYLKDRHGRERYMKWSYTSGEFQLEAWLKSSVGLEMDLDGIGAGSSRKEFRRSMEELIARLQSTGEQLSNGHVGGDPLHHDNSHHTLRDKTGRAAAQREVCQNTERNMGAPGRAGKSAGTGLRPAMLVAVAGIFFAWSFPIVGIILAVVSIRKRKEAADSRAVVMVAVTALLIAVIAGIQHIGLILVRMGLLF